MKVLGIHDGHDASAALMIDGTIVAAAQEERFSGLKGDYGFPKNAVDFCLNFAGVNSTQLDCVALSSRVLNPVLTCIKRNANFSVSHWVKEQNDFWKPLKFNGEQKNYYDIFKDEKFSRDTYYDYSGIISGYMRPQEMEEYLKRRVGYIANYLHLKTEKINVTNHETNHKCYALFGSFFRGEPVLVLTAEGIGDEYNGTVSVYKDGVITTLANHLENHLGHIYQYATLILGMKPAQHEYKVMGLAPYSNSYETNKAYKVFRKMLKVDGLYIKFDQRPKDLYFTIKEELADCRFDGIAGGVQKFLEEVLCEWTASCIKHTGIRKVVYAGGVAQNIKALKSVAALDCVDDIFVPPAAGDTSNAVGACYNLAYQLLDKNYSAQMKIQPLTNIYLGPTFTEDEVMNVIKETNVDKKFLVSKTDNTEIAKLLSEGNIIGLCRGRMEFGLRALGNRSILADPHDPMTLDRINQKVKFRDFWMPFTPSILDRRAKDYFKNPKRLFSQYMTMAFDSIPETRMEYPAAMHPADKTVRPQVVTPGMNQSYYDLLCAFEKLTGRGVLLNTSFNLHGKPVVLGPREAIFTFENSEIDALVLENILIRRKN